MDSLPQDHAERHSVELDRKFWENNPDYFFDTLAPRLSKYAERADDACIQAQIDVFTKDHVGAISGSLARSGNFAAAVYAESLPDRLPILAYLNEILSFYEAFEWELSEAMGATPAAPLPKDPEFDNPVWSARCKKVLSKIVKVLVEADPELGEGCIQALKALPEVSDAEAIMNDYPTMDAFTEHRIDLIAWPSVFACAEYSAALALTPAQKSATDAIFKPLWCHACCVYDYFTWEKELKEAKKPHMATRNIINGVPVLMRLHNISADDAKKWLKQRCLDYEKEYLRRKDAFLHERAEELVPDMRKWFDCQEAIATGFAIWCTTAFRHFPALPVEAEGYGEYYAKRSREGAVYFSESTESEKLLSGGFEIECEAGKKQQHQEEGIKINGSA